MRAQLARVLATLDERERLLLALARVDGLSSAEIARVVGGTTADAARSLMLVERKLARRARILMQPARGRTPAQPARENLLAGTNDRKEKMRWRA